MSAPKLHALTEALDAWENARACWWHRINNLIAEIGAKERLPGKPPPGLTLDAALSRLKVATHLLRGHLDIPKDDPWLFLGTFTPPVPLDPGAAENLLRLVLKSPPVADMNADFLRRNVVDPAQKHAEKIRAWLEGEKQKALEVAGSQDRGGATKRRMIQPNKRTRPMTLTEAASLMGYSGGKQQRVRKLRSAMRTNAVRFERQGRQQFVFDRGDFIKEAQDKIGPPPRKR